MPLLAVALGLFLIAVAGCGRTVHARSAAAIPGAGPGAAACAKASQAAGAATAVPASVAAQILSRDHVTPNPWAALPPSSVVYACLAPSSNGTAGTFVDSAGTSTPIPLRGFSGFAQRCASPSSPTTGAADATPFAGCSFQLGAASSPSGFSSSNKVAVVTIAAVVLAVAMVWILVSGRNRRARAAHRSQ